ncbi:MATE family efflux transporter [Faecalibacillus intestinalis]|uniref:MATE family efflux transporter n=1 Tax=Faecalibacillus intestinalis TaxID=1982626 RepID=UPI00295EC4A6|nr:MATE family efflux transporter [Faecalibacillus intestinalis]
MRWGITVLIARYIGEKKMNSIGALIGGATVVFAIISAIIFVVMITLASPISTLMQAPKEALGFNCYLCKNLWGRYFLYCCL